MARAILGFRSFDSISRVGGFCEAMASSLHNREELKRCRYSHPRDHLAFSLLAISYNEYRHIYGSDARVIYHATRDPIGAHRSPHYLMFLLEARGLLLQNWRDFHWNFLDF